MKAGGEVKEVWYKRHVKILWIICCLVFFIVVIGFALGLGLSLGGVGSGYFAGAFARTLGQECRFTCKNRPSYASGARNPLIVIAMDGLPNTVLQNTVLAENIRRLSECGARSQDMTPSFASTTYPNLWTILTGLYPEKHGISSDYMTSGTLVFEPRNVAEAMGSDLQDPQWYKKKPLWQTAREQGVITASHSWLGNNMNNYSNQAGQTINSKPHYFQPYNAATTYMDRMKTVTNWIEQGNVSTIPQFITVFFEDPGKTIRQYGINSKQADDSLTEVDLAVGYLLDVLMESMDSACINVMILSTTGVVATSCGTNNANVKFLQDEVPNNNLNGFSLTPDYLNSFARISVTSAADENVNTNKELADFLRCKVTGSGSVYTSDEIPTRLHYSSQTNLNDVFVLMKDGLSFARSSSDYNTQSCSGASDGYEPTREAMMGLFIGFGPDFKVSYNMNDFSNLDLYNIIAKIIGVTQEPNNGTMGVLNKVLKTPGTFPMEDASFATQSTCSYSASRDLSQYDTGCNCPDSANRASSLFANIPSSDNSATLALHTPFGAPRLLSDSSPIAGSTCRLYHSSYLMTYDKTLTISKYVSFTLKNGFSRETQTESCSITDNRLLVGENPKCSTYTDPVQSAMLPEAIKQSYLLQPVLAINNKDAGIISSNIVPQYTEFQRDIWDALVNKYQTWTSFQSTNGINVVQGPVYDLNHDGLADDFTIITSSSEWIDSTVVPSHYFVVATRCSNGTEVERCVLNNIQVLAFILPHNNIGIPCPSTTTFDDYIMDHLATIRDVERITGLSFFPDWQMSTFADIRMTITEIKVRAPTMMWTS